jgi:hypothetical protein
MFNPLHIIHFDAPVKKITDIGYTQRFANGKKTFL